MTEREAWLKLIEYVADRDLLFHGLCDYLYWMRHQWSQIDHDTYLSMKEQIEGLPAYAGSAYKWPLTKAGAEQRAAFCRAQAAKCEGVTT